MTTSSDEPRGQIFSRGAFALVIGLLIVRSLLLEVVRDAGPAVANAPPGPGATTSLVLDWLSLLPMLLVIARRCVDRSFTLRGGAAHVLLLALAVWAMLSTAWADDRFLAFVSATRLLAAASLFWTSTQLVRRWDHLRLIAGVLVGLLLANVAHGLITQFIDRPDLQTYWHQNREAFFQQRGWTPDTYEAQRFELKLLADELFGFNASPNTLGAIVVMFATVAIAAAIQRLRDRDPIGWPVALLVVAASGMYLLAHLSSKAAVGAWLLGGALLALWAIARRWFARQRLLAFAVGIALIGLAVVTVLGVGLVTGGLPSSSLNFRWRYWVGAWRIVLTHPTVGVGWANFEEHYLPVRLPQAAEEIQDPHDFAIRVAAELGGVGLTLLLGWLLSFAWRVTRPIESQLTPRAIASTKPVLMGLTLTLAGAWLVNVLAADNLATGDDGAFFLTDGLHRLMFVGLVGAGIALVLLRQDASKQLSIDGRPAPWLLVGLVIAIGLMLVQSTIDIALFQIAPLMLVAGVAGATLGIGWRDRAPRRESIPLIAISAATILALVFLVAGVVPIALAESRAADGQAAMARKLPDVAGRAYAAAFSSTYPLNNVDYAAHAAEAFTTAGPAHVAEARHWLDVATEADPSNAQAFFTRARIGKYWIDNGVPGESPDTICNAFARGLALNPSDAALQLEYAALLEHFGKPVLAAAAIDAALQVDDQLDPAEPERIELRTPGERDRLDAKRASLRAMH